MQEEPCCQHRRIRCGWLPGVHGVRGGGNQRSPHLCRLQLPPQLPQARGRHRPRLRLFLQLHLSPVIADSLTPMWFGYGFVPFCSIAFAYIYIFIYMSCLLIVSRGWEAWFCFLHLISDSCLDLVIVRKD
ncbi:hypothetical protein MUK42_17787 [Musa troglodytarum]|uniref:Uncharacterized protein n=1 Tax=Musa troglodytarum TaxID=320322 RepID=A0A9E7H6N2_9LILI|nr:hypothetical protein MUK42_17787 [Musa troglodytarum]